MSSIVRRLQAQVSEMQKHHVEEIVALRRENANLQEAHRSRQPEANSPEGGEAKSTAVNLPRATNPSVRSNIITPSFNTVRR